MSAAFERSLARDRALIEAALRDAIPRTGPEHHYDLG